ncbi:HEAT repeat domain-containing protein [Thermosulfurimonas dismutans]|uniref:HEAT repeat domain-containing protein n=1 Tax=Thermosulfurimonas dismutans TaxID=999894 RepID=A0A179D5E3_9BACT|nr:HEAT repeat domain-containing protein [Thermosulfurimonas dismutans]OAQ21011.1 hypothetical protein TDIS_0937 [Thermosulfurimonas dismutans]
MANRKAFKSDESFLKKISLGATGTIAIFDHLKKLEHKPIELERGSMSFKIWKKIKIKRIRVPDLLCIKCGRCIECRAKSKLEISMSHSESNQNRKWDYGLKDDDFVAFVACKQIGNNPLSWEIDGPIQYVSVRDLRLAHQNNLTILTQPKGAEEGFEMRIQWPASIASAAGTVISIESDRLKYRKESNGRIIPLKLWKQNKRLKPLVKEGEKITKNQIIASVVPVTSTLPCERLFSEEDFIKWLSSSLLTNKYAAIKALAFFHSSEITDLLVKKLKDQYEHFLIKLEAAASLFRQGNDIGYEFIKQCLTNDSLECRLEAVIILGEINNDASCQMLIEILLDKKQDAEIRAGAAWALGELSNKRAIDALIEAFNATEKNIQIEAARALSKLARQFTFEIIKKFSESNELERAGIAWALSQTGKFRLEEMLDLLTDEEARKWVAYIIGMQDPQRYINGMEQIKMKDKEVYFAVTVFWKIMSSWIWRLEENL